MKRYLALIFMAMTLTTSLFTACTDDSETADEAPALPPQASLSADLGNFPQNGSGRVDGTQEKTNFLFSSVNVVFWQTTLVAGIAIPAAAFQEAFNHEFTYDKSSKLWKSEYSVQAGGKTIEATLTASRTDADLIHWEMYLTVSGQFEDYLWFTGDSRIDNTGGDWTLYAGPGQSGTLLQIDWDRNGSDFLYSKYTLTNASSRAGSYIAYGETEEAGFSHFYEVSITDTAGDDYDVEIYVNEETKVGKVKSLAYFEDELWHCWDENLDDVACN